MKKIFLVSIAIIINLSPFSSLAQWNKSTSKTERSLQSVFMLNTSVGYAGGVDGIFKTSDGGKTWENLPFSGPDVMVLEGMNNIHIFFIDENVGYAAGWTSLYNDEIIIKTNDGGKTGTFNISFPKEKLLAPEFYLFIL